MSWVQFTRTDGNKIEVAAANICGQSESTLKGEPIITILMAGNTNIQVKDETLASVRSKVQHAIGRGLSVITEA